MWRLRTSGLALHATARIPPHQPVPMIPTSIVFIAPPGTRSGCIVARAWVALHPGPKRHSRSREGQAMAAVAREALGSLFVLGFVAACQSGGSAGQKPAPAPTPLPTVDLVIGNNFGHLPMFV